MPEVKKGQWIPTLANDERRQILQSQKKDSYIGQERAIIPFYLGALHRIQVGETMDNQHRVSTYLLLPFSQDLRKPT